MVIDLEVLAQFLHHLVIQIGGIVSDNLPGQIISFLMNMTTMLLVTLEYEVASTHLVR